MSLILGLSCLVFGIFTILESGYYSSKYSRFIDFGDYHVVFGTFITIIGLLFIYTVLRNKARKFEDNFVICPKCRTPFKQNEVPDGRCPKCEVELEDLEGFYQRHPELKVR